MSQNNQHPNDYLLQKSMELNLETGITVEYASIQDSMMPFDLIAFRGGDLMSDFISKLEKKELGIGTFSHVGMVVTSEILPRCVIDGEVVELIFGKKYVLESTFSFKVLNLTDGVPDLAGKGHLGVQLRDLEAVIPAYLTNAKTKVAWCPLLNNPWTRIDGESKRTWFQRRYHLQKQFGEFFRAYNGRLYEIDLIGLFGAMFPTLRLFRDLRDGIYRSLYKVLHKCGVSSEKVGPSGWQFCSELVANVYQTIGVIPATFDPRDVLPVDFFGYDSDGLPPLVQIPIYIQDFKSDL